MVWEDMTINLSCMTIRPLRATSQMCFFILWHVSPHTLDRPFWLIPTGSIDWRDQLCIRNLIKKYWWVEGKEQQLKSKNHNTVLICNVIFTAYYTYECHMQWPWNEWWLRGQCVDVMIWKTCVQVLPYLLIFSHPWVAKDHSHAALMTAYQPGF